eukprot:7381673-Prymnesium_polylepis.3
MARGKHETRLFVPCDTPLTRQERLGGGWKRAGGSGGRAVPCGRWGPGGPGAGRYHDTEISAYDGALYRA